MKRVIIALIGWCLLADAPAVRAAGAVQLPRTGQSKCYTADGSGMEIPCTHTAPGQDGDRPRGAAWPDPRFMDNANGTVTDNLTGLVWLRNADCFGIKTWADALEAADVLASGACGLTDGSKAGQWRLPNRRELQSLIDRSPRPNPPLPAGHPFIGVRAERYWSSSGVAASAGFAWYVAMSVSVSDGGVGYVKKGSPFHVWPVRGGQ